MVISFFNQNLLSIIVEYKTNIYCIQSQSVKLIKKCMDKIIP